VPAAPSNLAAIAVSSRQVALSWQDNSLNETGFVVERSSNSGRGWSQIAQVGAGVTRYTDNVSARKTYWYRVRAVGSGGYSAYSNIAVVSTQSGATFFGSVSGASPLSTPSSVQPTRSVTRSVATTAPSTRTAVTSVRATPWMAASLPGTLGRPVSTVSPPRASVSSPALVDTVLAHYRVGAILKGR
jgi:hypothetical protein